MQVFLNTLRVAILILPAVVELVRAMERAIPFRSVGPEKLQLLKDVLTGVYESLEEEARKGLSIESLLKLAAFLAGRFVQTFNKLGWPAAA